MNKRKLGAEMEDRAVLYLESKRYRILARNFRCRSGEIDLIAKDGRTLVFIEVKFRASHRAGDPEDSVTPAKIHRILHVAQYYRMVKGVPEDTPMRFDVLAIDEKGIRHITDAFWA